MKEENIFICVIHFEFANEYLCKCCERGAFLHRFFRFYAGPCCPLPQFIVVRGAVRTHIFTAVLACTFFYQTQRRDVRLQKEAAVNPKKKAKKTSKKNQPLLPPEEAAENDDGVGGWTEKGIQDYENTDAGKRRNKKAGSPNEVTLSKESRDRMPSLDDFMSQMDESSGTFALANVLDTCFDMNIPKAARDLFVNKVIFFSVLVRIPSRSM